MSNNNKLGIRKYKEILKKIKELWYDMESTIVVNWIWELGYMIDEPDTDAIFATLERANDIDFKIDWEIKQTKDHKIEHHIDYIDF